MKDITGAIFATVAKRLSFCENPVADKLFNDRGCASTIVPGRGREDAKIARLAETACQAHLIMNQKAPKMRQIAEDQGIQLE